LRTKRNNICLVGLNSSSLLLKNIKNNLFLSAKVKDETKWKSFKKNSSFVVAFDTAGERENSLRL
jgi:hypothetical protein